MIRFQCFIYALKYYLNENHSQTIRYSLYLSMDFLLTLRVVSKTILSRFDMVFSIFVAFDAMLAVTSCPSRVWIFSTFSFILSSEFAWIIGFDRPFSFLIRDQWAVVWPQEHGSSRAMIKWLKVYCGIGKFLKDFGDFSDVVWPIGCLISESYQLASYHDLSVLVSVPIHRSGLS